MKNALLRIGTLGAARITPFALVGPARRMPDVEVAAVAARAPARARAFARRHRIPHVYDSYDELIAAPELDAIYNPLPNSLHCEWSIKALRAGKHVLCEKPFAANATEAEQMAQTAAETDRVLVEAFHNLYHPLAARMEEIVDSDELGAIQHVEAHLCMPLLRPGDIRYRADLAGGATMDLGCYCIRLLSFLVGVEPDVVRAQAQTTPSGVDRSMTADLHFLGGITGRFTCALFSRRLPRAEVIVRGDAGEMRVLNPFLPHVYHRLHVRTAKSVRHERIPADTSYDYQLRVFSQAVRGEAMPLTDAEDAVANMRVIDAVYRKAGLWRHGAFSVSTGARG